MATEWFNNDGSGVAVHLEDPCVLIVGDYIPDWVALPGELEEDGGRQLRVTGHHAAKCPKCYSRIVRHLELEDRYYVAECKPGCGFVFYRLGAKASVHTKEETP